MKSTYSVSRAQALLPRLLKKAQNHVVPITRHNKRVAYIVSSEQLEALAENVEIISNPKAMKAIPAALANRTRCYPLPRDLADQAYPEVPRT